MRLFLDCEFSQLNASRKLISLAMVSESGREFYVELDDCWQIADCSEFVVQVVIPQLWHGQFAMSTAAARSSLLDFLNSFDEMLQVVTDAPQYDFELLCDLLYIDGKWPRNVDPVPVDATTLTALNDGATLPHHALLDARIIASMF